MRRNSVTGFAIAAAVGGVLMPAFSPAEAAQAAGVGAKYDSREPAKCASLAEPKTKGPPSNAQVAQYAKCAMEHESGSDLYLVENLKVQIAPKGRPYNGNSDIMTDIDIDVPIYAIRGSYLSYQCSQPSEYMQTKGKNCNTYDQPMASGVCYKTTFGDWECSMIDVNTRTQTRNVPPPK